MTRPNTASDITVLADQSPIASGTNREVWDRPNHPNQILKTVRIHKLKKYEGRSALRRALADLRHGPYGAFRSEYRCYLNTAYRCLQAGRSIPIAEIGGLVITDRGLAQVCEKVTDASGGLARTLRSMLKEKSLDEDHVRLLNYFTETLYMTNVNVPDLTASNILLDAQRDQFVLVDGYGDRTLIPARAWFKPLNQREMDIRFPRMAVPDFLHWDPKRKEFSLL